MKVYGDLMRVMRASKHHYGYVQREQFIGVSTSGLIIALTIGLAMWGVIITAFLI